jgi:ribonuclease P protein component
MARRPALSGRRITDLLNEGNWKRGRWINVCYRASEHGKWAVLVGRKFGGAVERNRAKRRIREISRKLGVGTTGWDIACCPKPCARRATYKELESDMVDLLRRLGINDANTDCIHQSL